MLKKQLNRYTNKIILLSFIILLYGCACNKSDKEDIWNNVPEYKITAELMHTEKEVLTAFRMCIADNYMITSQPDGDKLLSIFSIDGKNLKFIRSFVNHGKGPYEVNAAFPHYLPEYKSIVVVGYNVNGKNIIIPFDSENIDNTFDMKSWRAYQNTVTFMARGILPIDTTSFMIINAGKNDNKIFSVFNVHDQILNDLQISYPEDNVNAPLKDKTRAAYNGYVYKRPYNNDYVLNFDNGHWVKIFSCEGTEVTKEFNLFDELPLFTYQNNKIIRNDDCKEGLKLQVTQKYIYCGNPNITHKDFADAFRKNGYRAGNVKEIFISDWEGKPVAKLSLDIAVKLEAIDPEDKYLYGFTYDQETLEYQLVRYKLPEF